MELIGDCHAVLKNLIFSPCQTKIFKCLIKQIFLVCPLLFRLSVQTAQICLCFCSEWCIWSTDRTRKGEKWQTMRRLNQSNRAAYSTNQTTSTKSSSIRLCLARSWFLWSIKKCNKAQMKKKSKAQTHFLGKSLTISVIKSLTASHFIKSCSANSSVKVSSMGWNHITSLDDGKNVGMLCRRQDSILQKLPGSEDITRCCH